MTESILPPASRISIADYDYPLEEARIAKYPLPHREDSKLLIYKDAEIKDSRFYELERFLPGDSLLVFNNTRVIPARMFFTKDTGAVIEIFCLNPVEPSDYALAFAETHACTWRCVVGNSKKWKNGTLEYYNPLHHRELSEIGLRAESMEREKDTRIIRFSWSRNCSFAQVIEACGKTPIPPYLNRKAEPVDSERYQTRYARFNGSVAAPTAGLHFSDAMLRHMKKEGAKIGELTLHVGAGTFKPMKGGQIGEHIMHSEPFSLSREFLECLLLHRGPVVAVGTTSCRCLESLYYFGLMVREGKDPLFLSQWEAYGASCTLSYKESIEQILAYMDQKGLERFRADTQIMIVPSFRFRCLDALITNYHQPKSTLLLLVAAFVGDDWKKIYAHALARDYRFLSYGDSSLLFKNQLP